MVGVSSLLGGSSAPSFSQIVLSDLGVAGPINSAIPLIDKQNLMHLIQQLRFFWMNLTL